MDFSLFRQGETARCLCVEQKSRFCLKCVHKRHSFSPRIRFKWVMLHCHRSRATGLIGGHLRTCFIKGLLTQFPKILREKRQHQQSHQMSDLSPDALVQGYSPTSRPNGKIPWNMLTAKLFYFYFLPTDGCQL